MKNLFLFLVTIIHSVCYAQHYELDTVTLNLPPVSISQDSIYLTMSVKMHLVKAPEGKFNQIDRVPFAISLNSDGPADILRAQEEGLAYMLSNYPNNSSSALVFEVAGINPDLSYSIQGDSAFTGFQLITKVKNVPSGKFEEADYGKTGNVSGTSYQVLLSQVPAAGAALKNKLYPDIP